MLLYIYKYSAQFTLYSLSYIDNYFDYIPSSLYYTSPHSKIYYLELSLSCNIESRYQGRTSRSPNKTHYKYDRNISMIANLDRTQGSQT